MTAVHSAESISIEIEPQPADTEEESVIASMMAAGCGCHRGVKSQPCSSKFSMEYVRSVRASCAQLTRPELDMLVMGQLVACMNCQSTVQTGSRHSTKTRERNLCSYLHQGSPVCEKMFCFLHGIGRTCLKNLKRSLVENGIGPRTHGNTKRAPKHALSLPSVECVVRFLLNYAGQHGLLLPGRVPGYSRTDLKLLPSSISKRGIWRVYQAAAQDDTVHCVAYSTFCLLWRTLMPYIVIMRPMTDLCWQCQQNNRAILRSANASDGEKSDTLRRAEEHLRRVHVERSCYTSSCEDCLKSVRAHFTVGAEFCPPSPGSCIPENSNSIKVHYSFDYAQQVSYRVFPRIIE